MATIAAPGYRKQKRRGKTALAFVELNGRRRYLGDFGTPGSGRPWPGRDGPRFDNGGGVAEQWRPWTRCWTN
jgi:hypothetical protein